MAIGPYPTAWLAAILDCLAASSAAAFSASAFFLAAWMAASVEDALIVAAAECMQRGINFSLLVPYARSARGSEKRGQGLVAEGRGKWRRKGKVAKRESGNLRLTNLGSGG